MNEINSQVVWFVVSLIVLVIVAVVTWRAGRHGANKPDAARPEGAWGRFWDRWEWKPMRVPLIVIVVLATVLVATFQKGLFSVFLAADRRAERRRSVVGRGAALRLLRSVDRGAGGRVHGDHRDRHGAVSGLTAAVCRAGSRVDGAGHHQSSADTRRPALL